MEQVVRSGAARPLAVYLNPLAMARNLWAHRELTTQMAKRDILGRYRAAKLGLLWSVLTPLIMLMIYTFVFAVVFNFRWSDASAGGRVESRGEFALTMFCGMLLFNFFAEVANRAPNMIVGNPNYVKKVVFPLEIFVVSGALSALFNMLIGFLAWTAGMVLIVGWPPWTIVWLPVVLVPVWLTTVGVCWALASLGVFVRDVGHAVALGTQVLFFMTPIFYSIERVPFPYRRILELNPLSHSVEAARRVMMYGTLPEWNWWLGSLLGSAVLALVGYAFFMKSKRAFADVI
jgi:lipopolysaccharide transport system permease protein